MHLRRFGLCAWLLLTSFAFGDTTTNVDQGTPAVTSPSSPPALPPLPAIRPRRLRTNSVFYARTNAALPGATNMALPYTVNPNPLAPPVQPFINVPAALQWDSKSKEYNPEAGLQSQAFSFLLTNVWTNEVTIRAAHTSCGCTVAQLPSTPWILKPSEGGELKGTINLAGKFGSITKSVTLDTSVGPQVVAIRVNIPTPDPKAMNEGQRSRNLQVASADRQAVFRGDCASCHVSPTVGKVGKDLYASACGICHEGPTRASMVPDLHKLNKPVDHQYWTGWIMNGKPNSLMPAFALASGGILTTEQIKSLADYLTSTDFASATNTPVKTAAAIPPPVAVPAVAPITK